MQIPFGQQVVAILYSLTLLLVTIQLIRKHKLREQYSLIWLAAASAIFLLSIFDGLVNVLAGALAVTYAPTLILVLGLLFSLVILLSQSVAISSQADHIRDLCQSISILEWRLRRIEAPEEFSGVGPAVAGLSAAAGEGSEETTMTTTNHRANTNPFVTKRKKIVPAAAVPARQGPRRKVLVIGLDGATFDLIKPWAAEGYLPTLNRLLQEGAHGSLRSTIPPMTGPAWTSFATGVNPGKHRLYDWIARDEGSYRFSPTTALDCKAPTIYSLLSQANRRVFALNVPMTYPPTPVNGLMVSGLPAPNTRTTITYPASLYQEILDNVGDYILYPDPGQAYSDSGIDAFLERLYKAAELRVKTLNYLRSREDWDFGMMVFNGTDTISHAMWKFMDESHPLHDPARAEKYGNAIRDYYQKVDGYLAEIVDSIDEDTTLVLMSDHGFGPFHKFIHVNNWLMQEGFMAVKPGVRSRLKHRLFRAGFSPMNVYNGLMRMGLGSLKKEVVRGQGQGLMKSLFLSFEDIDWSKTKAYSLGNVGQIYLNVAGREPQGCVQPGVEYEHLRERIITRLYTLADPRTGQQVVDAVFRREDIYSGKELAHAPDIVFLPHKLEYFGFGEYEFGSHKIIEPMKRGISGTHRLNGIFMAYGKGIRPGAEVHDANLTDLAPTILHLMGEAVAPHMDGRVLDEALREPIASATETVQQPDDATSAYDDGSENGGSGDQESVAQEPVLSEADKQLLADRLRSLGYVG